jgi:hypothetical protein
MTPVPLLDQVRQVGWRLLAVNRVVHHGPRRHRSAEALARTFRTYRSGCPDWEILAQCR